MAKRGNPKSRTIPEIHSLSWQVRIDPDQWECLLQELTSKELLDRVNKNGREIYRLANTEGKNIFDLFGNDGQFLEDGNLDIGQTEKKNILLKRTVLDLFIKLTNKTTQKLKVDVDELSALIDADEYTTTLAAAQKPLAKAEAALNELFGKKFQRIIEDYDQVDALAAAIDQVTDIRSALLDPAMLPEDGIMGGIKGNLVRAAAVQELKQIFEKFELPTDLTRSGAFTSFGQFLEVNVYEMLGEGSHSNDALRKMMARDLKVDMKSDT